MAVDEAPEVSALAINVTLPEDLQWTNVRLLPDGRLAAKAYGRPTAGGRGAYVSFPVPDRPELHALVEAAATRAAQRWAEHGGSG